MNLLRSILAQESRFDALSLEDYANFFTYNGLQYPTLNMTMTSTPEQISTDFAGLVTSVYKRNGVVAACMYVRLRVFSEARFQFRQRRNGRPGDLFGTPELARLERPWPNGTTGDLLARAIQDADIAGNFLVARRADGLQRLRPDWTTIILGSDGDPDPEALDARVVGYLYQEGGPSSGKAPLVLDVTDVAHFAPNPDPLAPYRGMSWLTPILREVAADGAATTHKLKFFENGATPNLVVKLDANVKQEAFERWVELFERQHKGHLNAYKTLFLGGGADATVVGTNLRQLDFKLTQGAGETRIAAAAGVPPVIVGLSEGLQAATYSNYGQARRHFADATMRPLWRNIAASLSTITEVPGGAELWYDDRDIPFLQEDLKDAAEIQSVQARSIRQLVDAGFTPESVIAAVGSGDFSRLEHTGLFSVQLQPPQTTVSVLTPAEQAGRALAALLAGHAALPNGSPDE